MSEIYQPNQTVMQPKSVGSVISLALLIGYIGFIVLSYLTGHDGFAFLALSYKPVVWILVFLIMIASFQREGFIRTLSVISVCFLTVPMFYYFEHYYDYTLVVDSENHVVESVSPGDSIVLNEFVINAGDHSFVVDEDIFNVGDKVTVQLRSSFDRIAARHFICKSGKCLRTNLAAN